MSDTPRNTVEDFLTAWFGTLMSWCAYYDSDGRYVGCVVKVGPRSYGPFESAAEACEFLSGDDGKLGEIGAKHLVRANAAEVEISRLGDIIERACVAGKAGLRADQMLGRDVSDWSTVLGFLEEAQRV